MNPDFSFSSMLLLWKKELAELYPEQEIAAMFRIALEDILDLTKSQQLERREGSLSEEELKKLKDALEELSSGKPLQQVTGFTYFDDLKIMVSPDVLIPRPETEELVYEIVRSLPAGFSGRMIDWCTGSGCIALALKKHFAAAEVSGYDVSEEALEIAVQNAGSNGLKVDFRLKDALADLDDASPVDVIVSNPPYIPETEKTDMHRNVVEFEPGLALFVPNDEPLLFYEAITLKAVRELKTGGLLFFELHERFAFQTKELVEKTEAFHSVEVIKDLQGKDRMLKAVKN